jgi:hypothetical protein
MKPNLINTATRSVLIACLMLAVTDVQAAKPDGKGGGGTTEATSSGAAEFFWSAFDYVNRTLTLQGIDFISGDATTPIYPTEVTIGGKAVVIDQVASVNGTDFSTNEGSLVIPLENILDALVGPTSGGRVVEGGNNYEIKVVTEGGSSFFSAFFPRAFKDVPPDIESCPCASDYNTYYTKDNLAPNATFCSATQGISTDDYIEAGYGKTDGAAVILGSHRSWSSEPLYTSTCYVRDLSAIINGEETPQYLGASPQPVGDNDHLICVGLIESLESACNAAP